MNDKPVLVTLATGTQGSAVVDALLAAGIPATAYVRDPDSAAARALADKGASLAVGQLDDQASLEKAMQDVRGVFSAQAVGSDDDSTLEIRIGRAVLQAAVAASVPMLVHSSVARAGDHERFSGWSEGRWWKRYWEDKAAINALVRGAELVRWCILKPAVLMENHLPPKVDRMSPHLRQGTLLTAMRPETKLDMVSARDIGTFAVAAFRNPERFAGQEINLAAESLTMTEVAAIYSEVLGRQIDAVHVSAEEALTGLPKMVVDGHLWDDVEGYRVDIPALDRWGIPLTSLRTFAEAHADQLRAVVDAR